MFEFYFVLFRLKRVQRTFSENNIIMVFSEN